MVLANFPACALRPRGTLSNGRDAAHPPVSTAKVPGGCSNSAVVECDRQVTVRAASWQFRFLLAASNHAVRRSAPTDSQRTSFVLIDKPERQVSTGPAAVQQSIPTCTCEAVSRRSQMRHWLLGVVPCRCFVQHDDGLQGPLLPDQSVVLQPLGAVLPGEGQATAADDGNKGIAPQDRGRW